MLPVSDCDQIVHSFNVSSLRLFFLVRVTSSVFGAVLGILFSSAVVQIVHFLYF